MLRQRMITLLSRLAGIDTIVEAHNCATTLAAIDNDRPDVVLLDLRMPDGSGLDVLRELQQREHRPYVMVLTTWGDPDVRQLCLEAGADEFFEKGAGVMGAVAAIETLAAGAAA